MNKQTNLTNRPCRYSFVAMALMIGVPVLIYVLAGAESVEMGEAIKLGQAPNIANVAMGGSLFLLRIGAMIAGTLGILTAFFRAPKENAPKWMIRR